MATTPDADVLAHLNTNVAALTTGTNLFQGKVQASDGTIPDTVVFCLATGGPAPEAYIDGNSGTERYYSGVQCRIRSGSGTSTYKYFEDGQTLARSVRDAIHHATIVGYIDVRVLESEPIYIGEDSKGRQEWTVNVQLWHEE